MLSLTVARLTTLALTQTASPPPMTWREVAKGVEYTTVAVARMPVHGDGLLHIVRVAPERARVRVFAVSQQGGANRTARQWRDELKLVAAINAGMYQEDFLTHTGYLRLDQHINSRAWIRKYQSIMLLGPRTKELPNADVVDVVGASAADFEHYDTVVQNLRLIRAPGTNVWRKNGRAWSEAALAMDSDGRLLLLFSRTPLMMHDFNKTVLSLGLGIVRAMHLEGGPEASLSLRGEGVDLNLSGSFETGFNENDDNRRQWPLPNIIGVEAVAP